MFYTLTIDGRDQLIEPHDTLDDAERFAQEVAEDGLNCMVLKVLSVVEAEEQPYQSMEDYHGLKAGVDFPATL